MSAPCCAITGCRRQEMPLFARPYCPAHWGLLPFCLKYHHDAYSHEPMLDPDEMQVP